MGQERVRIQANSCPQHDLSWRFYYSPRSLGGKRASSRHAKTVLYKEGLRGQPLEGMAPRSCRMSTEKQQKDTRESGGASTVSARVSTLETMKKSRGVENCVKEESGDQIVEGL